MYRSTPSDVIERVADGARIPPDPDNADYAAVLAWLAAGNALLPAAPPTRDEVWARIKAERDRRKYLGVKVGEHWFHSDDASRIQQVSLVLMGQAMPVGIQWKTLTATPPPVFVTMTPALALAIFNETAASDVAIFAAAEAHRVAMEAAADPGAYDFSAGWPHSIEDEMQTVHRD